MKHKLEIIIVNVGFIGSVITIVVGYDTFSDAASPDGRLGIQVLSFFLLVFLASAVFQEYRYSRKARYAESTANINTIYEQCIKDIETELSYDIIGMRIQVVCDQMANMYSMITGTRCSTCIKIIDQKVDEITVEQPSLEVTTIARDSNSLTNRSTHSKKVLHFLNGNSDFYEIFKEIDSPSGRAFYSNNLSALQNYANTSFEIYGFPIETKSPFFRKTLLNRRWTLPYNSAIVAPIYSESATEPLVGFLCVDSPARGVFYRRYDKDIVCSMARALYPLILKWHEINDQKNMEVKDEGTTVS